MSKEPEHGTDDEGRPLDKDGIPQALEGLDFNIRPRRTRPKGWLKQAIEDGSVRDPKLGPNPKTGRRPRGNATVVDLPVMTVEGDTT